MNRYDAALKKSKKRPNLKVVPDTIADEIAEFVDNETEGNEFNAGQTPIRGTTLLIRGPNGFQIQIPKRLLEIRQFENELRIKLPANVINSLLSDVNTTAPDEAIRLRDVPRPREGRRGF